jgi:DnaK suppressor protein
MPLTPEFLSEIRADLERQKAKLERSMPISDEAVRTVELDQQAVGRLSRMDLLQGQNLSQNLRDRELARYGAIMAALHRLDVGTYGTCETCGAEIEAGRLMVFPEAPNCASCG